MTPPIDLPPPPPAIHAPAPVRTVQHAASPFSMNARTVRMLESGTAFNFINDLQGGWLNHKRYIHTKHHRGAKHKSQKSRSNKRKAARRK